jgi:predicted MFS family arabinose efflux permease
MKNKTGAPKINGITIFMAIIALTGLATGLSDGVLANYFKEAYDANAAQRGFIEFPREIPGVVALFFIAALSFLKNVKTAIITQLLTAVGLVVLGFWRPSFAVMCVFLFIFSLGTHMSMPLKDSIALSLSKGHNAGTLMGRFNGMRMAFAMVAGILTFFGFRGGWFNFDTPVLIFLIAAVGFILIALLLALLRIKAPVTEAEAPVNAKFVFRKQYMRYYIICALFGGRKQIMIVYSPWVLIELLGFRADTMAILAVTGAFIGIFFMPAVGKWIDRYGVKNVMIVEAFAFIGIYVAYGILSRIVGTNAVAVTGIAMMLVYLLNILDRMSAQFGMVRKIYIRAIAVAPEDVTPSLSLGMSIDHVLAIAGASVCGVIWYNFGAEYVFILAGLMSLGNLLLARGIKLSGPGTKN